MKKSILIILLSLSAAEYVTAQVLRIATSPSLITSQIPGYSQVATINTKTIAYTPSTPDPAPTPVDGDSTTEDDKVYHYADVVTANITMTNGNITSTSAGKVWTLRVSIANALNISLLFNQFNLSATAQMYVFNEAKTVLDSCIKKSDFTSSSSVGLTPMTGNSLIIYIIEPNNTGTLQSSIAIQKVEAGFQDMPDVGDAGGGSSFSAGPQPMEASIDCNPMIQCQPSKLPYARAVARFISNGHNCTCTLINNENNNGRAYFLTAFHCLDVSGNPAPLPGGNGVLDADEIAALATARVQFRLWRTKCNGNIIENGIDFSGAVVRASSKNSDVVLLELTNPPGIGDLVNYAGYNRQTSAPADYNGFVIHHPQGEDMRITSLKKVNNWIWNDNFWTAHYSSGTVTRGSSGSALMNGNGQIIGQLRSGWSSCDVTDFGDRYGKFYKSWSNAGLQTWLSPNQNLQSTSLLNLTDIPIAGPNIIACTTPTQLTTLPNLLDVTYTWSVSAGLQITNGQGTSAVTISGLSGNQYGSGTLTLTLGSPTKGRFRTYTVSKNITIYTGYVSGTYVSPTSNTQPLVSPTDRFDLTTYNNTCLATTTKMNIPSGATVTWSGSTSSSEVVWTQTGNDISCYFNALNQTADLTIKVVSSCGTTNTRYRFKCTSTNTCGGISPLVVSLFPNPSADNIQVALEGKSDKAGRIDIYEIRIIDKMGNMRQINKYGANHKQVNIDISSLQTGFYTIRVFNGRVWTDKKFIKI